MKIDPIKPLWIAVAALLIQVLSPAAAVHAEGFYYEATQTVSEGKKKEQTQWRVRGWVDGSSAKVEFLDSMNPLFPAGSYLLTVEGGSDLLVVNPKEKTYTRWNLEELFATFGTLLTSMSGVVSLDFDNFESETLSEEAGPEVLGLSTQFLEYTTAYTMKMKAVGIRRAYDVSTNQKVWTTDEIDAPGMFVWLKSIPSTGDEDFDQILGAEMERVKGLALKVESTSRMVGKKKKRDQVSTSTMEVTTLRRESVDGKTFEVPAGYTETEAEDDPTGMGAIQSIFGKKSG